MSSPSDPFKYTDPSHSGATNLPDSKPAGERPIWQQAAMVIGGFAVLLYVLEFVDMIARWNLDNGGIQPRTIDGLWGIVFAPVLHYGWGHLIANTIPFLVLGFLVLLSGIGRGLAATGIIWVIGGLGTWLFGSAGTHLGASVIVFGWLTYLIARGIFSRHFGQLAIGLVVLVIYGGLLWGVLPGRTGISWEGHLFGAIGGVVAAWALASDVRKAREAKALNG